MKRTIFYALCCVAISLTLSQVLWAQSTTFGPGQIVDSLHSAKDARAADLDNDGDMDVLSVSMYNSNIVWYENDGSGNFGAEQIITTSTGGANSVHVADLDNDGDMDVLSASAGDDSIAWYENDGSGGFGAKQIITTSADGANSVYAADLDNDGDMDVLSASYHDDKIAWYENDGSGGFGAEQIITTSADGANSVSAADMDNDGDIDVLSTSSSDNKIAWYENDGSGNFGAQQVITEYAIYVSSVYAVDLDNDGDMDVLTTSPYGARIIQNYGDGNFGGLQLIGGDDLFSNLAVYAADLDNDGDMDILCAYDTWTVIDRITWHENDGSGNFGTQQIITDDAQGSPIFIYAADLDDDGDMDVLSRHTNDNVIVWYENLLAVFSPAVAEFSTTPSTTSDTLVVCSQQAIYFNNQSQNATDFLWDFGNGDQSAEQNPVYSYSQPGTYTVSLIANNNNVVAAGSCEADAGVYGNAGFDGYMDFLGQNTAPPYQQNYALYGVDGGLLATSDISYGFQNADAVYLVAYNYNITEVIPDISTLNALTTQAESDQCIDVDVYSYCDMHNIYFDPAYSYYNQDIHQNVYGNYIKGHVMPMGDYQLVYDYLDFWNSYGGYVGYYGDANGQPFENGDTLYVCSSFANACCDTVIFAAGGGLAPKPEGRLLFEQGKDTNPIPIEPINAQKSMGGSDTATMVVVVLPAIAPNITCVSAICNNDTAQYATNAVCSSYLWDVQGGTILEGQGTGSISVVWQTQSPGIITLSADCGSGYCSLPTVATVPVIADNISIGGKTNVCSNEMLTYTAPLLGNTNYVWEIVPAAAGTIVTGQGTNIVLVQWGNIPATLHLSYQNSLLNCGGTADLPITPVPVFTITALTGGSICAGNAAELTSMGNDVLWASPNGTIVSGQNSPTATIIFNQAGSQTITATALTPDSYCNATAETTIHVLAPPNAPSINGATNVCLEQTYLYQTTPVLPNLIYTWSVQGGTIVSGQNTTAVGIQWQSTSPKKVSLTAQSTAAAVGCVSDTTTLDIVELSSDMMSIDGNNLVCSNSTESYMASPVIGNAGYTWSIIPGEAGTILMGQNTPNITVQWHNNTGDAAVLQVALCAQTATMGISFGNLPHVAISSSDTLCSGGSIVLSANDSDPAITYDSYTWYNGNQTIIGTSPTLTVNSGGVYNVEVTTAYGCISNDWQEVNAYTSPVADILASSATVCIQNPIDINLYAINGTNYIFEWIGNDVPVEDSNSPFLLHEANADVANFTYQVQVTDTSNNCKTLSSSININHILCPIDTAVIDTSINDTIPPPPPPLCPSDGVHQLNISTSYDPGNCQTVFLSYDAVGTFSNIVVLWGDGSQQVLSGSPVSHTYIGNEIAIHNILVKGDYINGITGNSCVLVRSVALPQPLFARFDVETACLGGEWAFKDRSYYLPTTSVASWTYDFGDGSLPVTSLSSSDATHVYGTAGTYVVSLTISNGVCAMTTTKTIIVNAIPQADFGTSGGSCAGNLLSFMATDPANNYFWQFGDGTSSNEATPAHLYNSSGTYTVSLQTQDEYGCLSLPNSQDISVSPAPEIASITASDTIICIGSSTLLTAPTGSSYLWSSGETNSTISVTQSDTYSVQVTLADGCYYTTPPRHISNYPQPNADIYPSGSPLVLCSYNADTLLSVPTQPNYTYLWNNGNTNAQILVGNNGTYSVTVTDTTTGCTRSKATQVTHTYVDAPYIDYSVNIFCEGSSSTLSVVEGAPDKTYVWTNGMTGEEIEVYLTGSYGATAIDTNGCHSEISQLLNVTAIPMPNVEAFPSGCYETCIGDTIIIGNNAALSYQWFFEGQPLVGYNEDRLIPVQSGDYYVVMNNNFGCIDTTQLLHLTLTGICPQTTLPINLLHFIGTVLENGNQLEWQSSSEVNNDHYTLYRSTNGTDFMPIHRQQGSGTTPIPQRYTYLDSDAPNGISYYRLSQSDYDGKETHLSYLSLYRSNSYNTNIQIVNIYPQPATEQADVEIRVNGADEFIRLQLYAIDGKLINTAKLAIPQSQSGNTMTLTTQLDLSHLPKGIYLLQATTSQAIATAKIVKQ